MVESLADGRLDPSFKLLGEKLAGRAGQTTLSTKLTNYCVSIYLVVFIVSLKVRQATLERPLGSRQETWRSHQWTLNQLDEPDEDAGAIHTYRGRPEEDQNTSEEDVSSRHWAGYHHRTTTEHAGQNDARHGSAQSPRSRADYLSSKFKRLVREDRRAGH